MDPRIRIRIHTKMSRIRNTAAREEPNIKFASSGNRTWAACVTGGYSTVPTELSKQLILWVVGASNLTAPKPASTSWNLHHNTTQQYGPHTTVGALDSPQLHLHKITYWPMILMALCIIDFIGANGLLGAVGGRGPWTLLGPNGTRFARCHLRAQECPGSPTPHCPK